MWAPSVSASVMIMILSSLASSTEKSAPTPAPMVQIMVLISSFLRISLILAFSVLRTFPRSGRIAWNLRSRPCLAEPPAESPSTRQSSFFLGFLDWAGVNLPDKSPLSFLLFLPFRLSSRAFRAASRASRALIALRIRLEANSPFSMRKKVNLSETMLSTTGRAKGLPNLSLVCPSNCKWASGTRIERTADKPSRQSDPSRFLSFSLRSPVFLAQSFMALVMAVFRPVSWVPPSFVRTLLTKDKILSE